MKKKSMVSFMMPKYLVEEKTVPLDIASAGGTSRLSG